MATSDHHVNVLVAASKKADGFIITWDKRLDGPAKIGGHAAGRLRRLYLLRQLVALFQGPAEDHDSGGVHLGYDGSDT
jgi:hypothetical protein